MEPPGGGELSLAHHGKTGELYAISLINVLYRILTLGVYHFWAKTRVRKYVWSQTSLQGERFEYTGRALEMLIGYALAMGILIPLVLAWQFLVQVLLVGSPGLGGLVSLPVYLGFIYLAGFARYSSLRYMLSRTRWRGIRFGLVGSPWNFALATLGYTTLLGMTMGLYWPMMQIHLSGAILNNLYFGDSLRVRFQTGTGGLFRKFLLFWGGAALLYFGIMVFIVVLFRLTTTEDSSQGALPLLQMAVPMLAVAGAVTGFSALWLAYRAAELRFLAAATRLEPAAGPGGQPPLVQVAVDFSTWEYIKFKMTNNAAMVLSLGMAYPWVLTRTMHFACKHLRLQGDPDLDALAQSSAPPPRTGEGLAEAFDLGGI
ncbi:MAG: YjgN family protein [Deltaproteobacteria bacterium]|nr:YjgN family protein [Deltaproteobacteria bacterium]